jgi:hypothetical protein
MRLPWRVACLVLVQMMLVMDVTVFVLHFGVRMAVFMYLA